VDEFESNPPLSVAVPEGGKEPQEEAFEHQDLPAMPEVELDRGEGPEPGLEGLFERGGRGYARSFMALPND
jgi:hypothetical protein